MKVSYTWLQEYFADPLPAPEKLAEHFTFHSCEVEEVEQKGNDTVLDLKILPDRANYALSHRGIAYELAAIAGLKRKPQEHSAVVATSDTPVQVSVSTDLCRRYSARLISGISASQSPAWLKERLETVGQRSISAIVDATNYVMLNSGQPLHAFDADKVQGGIVVRLAKAGESIGLLPEKVIGPEGKIVMKDRSIILSESDIVIADDAGPIALAGVKGGLRASVTDATKNIILESANFDPSSVRKTSTRYALRNDSSKRFENNLSPEFTSIGMEEVTALIRDVAQPEHIGPVADAYPHPAQHNPVEISHAYLSRALGTELSPETVEGIFDALEFAHEKKGDMYVVTPPWFRRDIAIPEDLIEEVGRIYGYDKIPAALPAALSQPMPINKIAYWSEKIKDMLVQRGYSEVSTYALVNAGDVEIKNPLASDKNFLRTSLAEGVFKSLELNSRNAALLGLEEIKIFEIGNVFTADEEYLSLALGYNQTKSIKNKQAVVAAELAAALEQVGTLLGVSLAHAGAKAGEFGSVLEIRLGDVLEGLADPAQWDVAAPETKAVKYAPISVYPFMTRDIAVFTPEGTDESMPRGIIEKHGGGLLVRLDLFDVFTKTFPDGSKKTSYAFRLVFQSYERTLVDDEINAIMQRIADEMNGTGGWQVR